MDWPCVPVETLVLVGGIGYEGKRPKLTVAVHVVDVNVCCVALGREAVVANVDPGSLDGDVLDVERVEEVGVFGEDGGVGRLSSTDDVSERNL